MKKHTLIIAASLMVITMVLLAGCVSPVITKNPGPTVTRTYDFTDFTSVDIGHAFKLELTQADTYSVTINAGENIFDHIEVTRTDSRLKIDADTVFFSFHRAPKATITMPELRGLILSGASEGIVTGFRSPEDFELTVSGASELDMDMETGAVEAEISGASEVSGRLIATGCDIQLSGASRIKLEGSGGNTDIDASGASQVDLEQFTVKDADINFSGASEGSMYIDGRMDVTLSGASSLEYSGNPTLGDFNLSGGSQLEKS